ncbi:MAG: lipopolysaccharide assembly protein LapB, partial [Gammaproteobacteria bacterium]
MDPTQILVLVAAGLLPVAAASGWYLGRRASERSRRVRVSELSSSYFRGLNYLLNEQPDKAIEVFLQLAEFNRDTVETHLALGNLFRRRGEVDRAIRVHQHLIARPNLSEEEKTIALLELGEDYMRAGLLDRAETLFTDLVAMDAQVPSALRHLIGIGIYQHEKDWEKAIEHARRMEKITGESQGATIAQFYCELAEQARAAKQFDDARKWLDQALHSQPESVRAQIVLGHLELQQGDVKAAASAFERVATLDVDYVPEILPQLLDSYARLGQMDRAEKFLLDHIDRSHGVAPVIALAKLFAASRGEPIAIEFLRRQLRQRPSVRGLMTLIVTDLHRSQGEARDNLLVLQDLTRRLLEGQAAYRCTKC